METQFEEIAAKALALGPGYREELAELLLKSIGEGDAEAAHSAWVAEVRRRDEEIRSGIARTKPAEQVLKEAREGLR